MLFDRHRGELRGIVVGVFENRQAAEDLAGCQHLPAHAADDVFEAEFVGVGVIALRAGELAEADGHHLEQAAFDLAREIGVPLDAADQHDAVALKGVAVHEGLDAVAACGRAETTSSELITGQPMVAS